MRRVMAVFLAVLLIGVWAVVPGRSAPVYGPQQTVVVVKDASDAVSLDPNRAYEESSLLGDLQMYSTLVKFPPGNLTQVRPSLASSWQVSKDTLTYTFHLKHGIKFSSGNLLTAGDVVYSFQRVVSLAKNPASWLITQTGIDDKNISSGVTAPDPYTVVIALPKPFSPGAFLSILANNVVGIVDSKTVKAHVQGDDWGSTWLNDHSAGTGPFQLAQWERQVRIEMVANPNYNLGPAPAIKRIVIINIMENTVQRQMLGRGDAEIAWDLSAAQLASLKQDPKFYVAQTPHLAMEYLGMDVKNVPAFGKAEVRRAVKYAIDYDGIIHGLVAGNALPLQGVIPKGLFGYDPSLPFKRDVARAKQLLSEAGFGSGFNVELLASTGTESGGVSAGDLASKIKNDLAEVGIRVDVRQIAQDEKLKTYRAQKSQMIIQNWFVDYPDPDDFAAPFADYTQKSLAWRLQYYNDPLSKLAQQASGLENTPERGALYKKINDMWEQDGPFAILYQPMISQGVTKRLRNYAFDPVNFIDFVDLTKQ
jgi:peptide/nickel transport system substrate-binding protein